RPGPDAVGPASGERLRDPVDHEAERGGDAHRRPAPSELGLPWADQEADRPADAQGHRLGQEEDTHDNPRVSWFPVPLVHAAPRGVAPHSLGWPPARHGFARRSERPSPRRDASRPLRYDQGAMDGAGGRHARVRMPDPSAAASPPPTVEERTAADPYA